MLLLLHSQNHFLVGHLIFALLFYNNLITELLILIHLLLIVGLWVGVIFVGVGLFYGLCGFVLAAPAQQHTKGGGWSDPQSASWKEGLTKNQPNNNQNPITSRQPT